MREIEKRKEKEKKKSDKFRGSKREKYWWFVFRISGDLLWQTKENKKSNNFTAIEKSNDNLY